MKISLKLVYRKREISRSDSLESPEGKSKRCLTRDLWVSRENTLGQCTGPGACHSQGCAGCLLLFLGTAVHGTPAHCREGACVACSPSLGSALGKVETSPLQLGATPGQPTGKGVTFCVPARLTMLGLSYKAAPAAVLAPYTEPQPSEPGLTQRNPAGWENTLWGEPCSPPVT